MGYTAKKLKRLIKSKPKPATRFIEEPGETDEIKVTINSFACTNRDCPICGSDVDVIRIPATEFSDDATYICKACVRGLNKLY